MRRILSIIGGLALALMFSQFPEYAQQYVQRLGGAVDELRILTEEFDSAAAQSGLSRDAAVARFATTGDSFVAGRGESMVRTFARYELLKATLAEIEGASGWTRFTLLPKYLDTDIGQRTLEAFVPGVPVSMEGFAYAAAGFLAGYLIVSGLIRFLLLPFSRRRARDEDEDEIEYLPSPPPKKRLEAVLAPRVEPGPLPAAAATATAAAAPEPVIVPFAPIDAEPLPVVDAEPVAAAPAAPAPAPAPQPSPRPEPRPAAQPEGRAESGFVHPAVAAARRRHQQAASGRT